MVAWLNKHIVLVFTEGIREISIVTCQASGRRLDSGNEQTVLGPADNADVDKSQVPGHLCAFLKGTQG